MTSYFRLLYSNLMEADLNCAIQFLQEERYVTAWVEEYALSSISKIRIGERVYSFNPSVEYKIPLSLPIFPGSHYHNMYSKIYPNTVAVDLVGQPVCGTAVLDNEIEVSLDNLYPMWATNVNDGIVTGYCLIFLSSFPEDFRELPEPDEQMYYHLPPSGGYTKGVRKVN